ncbi:MAG TPA: DNA recombination protein RmuC [Candidatus Cryosericum sp.]|nr:DNA recombination protein RmuC [Candidatus Cryosericum sp.]
MELTILVVSLCVFVLTLLALLFIYRSQQTFQKEFRSEQTRALSELRRELADGVQSSVSSLGRMILDQQRTSDAQGETRFKTFEVTNEQKLEAIRLTVERRLIQLQTENAQKLDEMRKIVDEKLQKTLETKVAQSFQLVNERLEQVYKGLGEMQTLAAGVGDLKKVLSNVKTRGMLGEIQLGAILEEILAPEQYERDVVIKPGSKENVEYAIKIPAADGISVLLPIDSKFPADLYAVLQDAYESGSKEAVTTARSALIQRIRMEAVKIRDKYIDPPHTTDYAFMFLPFEGLYAEVTSRGLVEELQRSCHVILAGPSNMAALLNTVQMAFRSFAIQQRSSEVWRVLGAVKTEFANFSNVLAKSRTHLRQADEDLEKLIGVRARAITQKLRSVEKLDEVSTGLLLGTASIEGDSADEEADDADAGDSADEV